MKRFNASHLLNFSSPFHKTCQEIILMSLCQFGLKLLPAITEKYGRRSRTEAAVLGWGCVIFLQFSKMCKFSAKTGDLIAKPLMFIFRKSGTIWDNIVYPGLYRIVWANIICIRKEGKCWGMEKNGAISRYLDQYLSSLVTEENLWDLFYWGDGARMENL